MISDKRMKSSCHKAKPLQGISIEIMKLNIEKFEIKVIQRLLHREAVFNHVLIMLEKLDTIAYIVSFS